MLEFLFFFPLTEKSPSLIARPQSLLPLLQTCESGAIKQTGFANFSVKGKKKKNDIPACRNRCTTLHFYSSEEFLSGSLVHYSELVSQSELKLDVGLEIRGRKGFIDYYFDSLYKLCKQSLKQTFSPQKLQLHIEEEECQR